LVYDHFFEFFQINYQPLLFSVYGRGFMAAAASIQHLIARFGQHNSRDSSNISNSNSNIGSGSSNISRNDNARYKITKGKFLWFCQVAFQLARFCLLFGSSTWPSRGRRKCLYYTKYSSVIKAEEWRAGRAGPSRMGRNEFVVRLNLPQSMMYKYPYLYLFSCNLQPYNVAAFHSVGTLRYRTFIITIYIFH